MATCDHAYQAWHCVNEVNDPDCFGNELESFNEIWNCCARCGRLYRTDDGRLASPDEHYDATGETHPDQDSPSETSLANHPG
jgi:hypothetical protein